MSGTRTPSLLTCGYLPSPGSHRGRCQCSLPYFSYDGASRNGRNVAWSRWYRQVDRPCLESKIDQNKISSDVASKLSQRRRPGESAESWHKDTIHLLEQYRRTTSVAYPPAIAVDTLLTRLILPPGSYAAEKVLLCRAATVPAESTFLSEVNRAIASLYPLFPYSQRMSTVNWIITPSHLVVVPLQVALRHSLLPFEVHPGPSLPTMSARVSIDTCAWFTSAILRPRMASTRRPGFPRRRGRPSSRQARLCWKIGNASPTHVPATISCFRDILQQIVLPTRDRPPPYKSSSSGLPQRTNLFFRGMTFAL
jgi:hypothetical protein